MARQLFEPALAGDPEAERLLSGAAALARPVLGLETPAERASRSDDSSSLEVLHGRYWLTVNLSANGPMLIAVDDAHLCDGASLRFLLYLRRRLEGPGPRAEDSRVTAITSSVAAVTDLGDAGVPRSARWLSRAPSG